MNQPIQISEKDFNQISGKSHNREEVEALMDKILNKVEGAVDNVLDTFKEKPIKTSVLAILVYWIIKKIWNWAK